MSHCNSQCQKWNKWADKTPELKTLKYIQKLMTSKSISKKNIETKIK